MQQLPKDENIREQYCVPPGFVMSDNDYKQLELCALSQDCLFRYGYTKMGERINTGEDLHRWFGVEKIKRNIPLEEAAKISDKESRQQAKAALFG